MNAFSLFCFLLMAAPAMAMKFQDAHETSEDSAANPVRKVVKMLQAMQKKVTEEGETEKELYEKFQCYCKTGAGTLGESIAAAEAKVPAVSSDIEQGESQQAQLQSDLKQHQVDRDDAKKAMAAATSIREKEAAAFAAEKKEADSNIGAIKAAVAALEKGMSGAFIQGGSAQTLKKLIVSKQDMSELDRQTILSFLSGEHTSEYSPASGEITGILKGLGDEMAKSLAEATTAENDAKANYESLMSAKQKEVGSLTSSIETKTQRVGELAVHIVQMKNDLSDTQASLLEDKKFLSELDGGCDTKAADFEERTKTRAEELVALAETIKLLNDDDALELFKKTLPSASASFVQVSDGIARKALAILEALQAKEKRPELDFIAMALKGKKIGFAKVIKMIDEMISTLGQEQKDDEQKKEYCGVQLDATDDKKKSVTRAISDAETAIANAEEGLTAVKEELAATEAAIKALDKSVAEATEQRQEEHAEFTSLMASDTAAKELLGMAKNRLAKFYNKALYKAPPKRELSEEDRIAVNMGGTATPTEAPGGIAGTGITAMAELNKAAPPPPPATYGAYSKKSGESTGVIAMLDLLIKDLDKEMTESQTQEKDSQKDYEASMQDAASKRAQDSKALMQKSSTKADLETDLLAHNDDKTAAGAELLATSKVISSLHAECDWLLKYFDVRAEARSGEIDSLKNAKAILSGADFA